MNSDEEFAWNIYQRQNLRDQLPENMLMYRMIFLAGYRAAKQSAPSDIEDAWWVWICGNCDTLNAKKDDACPKCGRLRPEA